MKYRRNVRAGGTGDPRENPLISGIVRYDSHLRKSRSIPQTAERITLGNRSEDYLLMTTAATETVTMDSTSRLMNMTSVKSIEPARLAGFTCAFDESLVCYVRSNVARLLGWSSLCVWLGCGLRVASFTRLSVHIMPPRVRCGTTASLPPPKFPPLFRDRPGSVASRRVASVKDSDAAASEGSSQNGHRFSRTASVQRE
ncbi:hypothetical protein PR048_005916 [Dryococelus australis]|uniref:Uncharacterized protein n=1 Tax=Dryococelus australis TaxID=614101 RepID=A0ABQ9I9I1_9NEOP|nr:hypothetical protein PR048_005916 [Dryococelus australis]